MEFAAYLLVGLALGGFAAWLFNRETRRQLAEVNRNREATLVELREESSRRASFEALAAGIPDLQKEIEARSLTIAQQGRTILEVTNQKQALAATLEAERKAFDEKLKLLEQAKSALSDAFNALSANALRSNSEEFFKLAQASVAPIKEALGKFDSKIQALEIAREGAYQGLLQQVNQLVDTGRQLKSETSTLAQALRSPVVGGQWGEIQLRRVVEMAGMLDYCDFSEQETLRSESRSVRPDLIVRLPAGKTIVVDAKAPVSAYLDAMSLPEAERRPKLQAFAKNLKR